jgi:hypothetical protein
VEKIRVDICGCIESKTGIGIFVVVVNNKDICTVKPVCCEPTNKSLVAGTTKWFVLSGGKVAQ